MVVGCAYTVLLGLLVFTPIGWLLNRLTVLLYRVWNYDLKMPWVVQPEQFGAVLNVLLFIPVGVLLMLVLQRGVLATTGVGLLVSLTIETLQYAGGRRQGDWVDVVTNTLGTLVGAFVCAAWTRRRRGAALEP